MGKAQVVLELVQRGVDLELADESGRTPLMWAATSTQVQGGFVFKPQAPPNPTLETRSPDSWTLSPEAETRKPKPETRNPKPRKGKQAGSCISTQAER
jgi:hypothetical protein